MKWSAVQFVGDLYHGIWMTVLLVKSTAYARTEQETLVQCFTAHVAGQQRQWDTKLLSHTSLNPKTEQALRRQILYAKVKQVEHTGQVLEIKGRTFHTK
jgi:hypothetical protein